LALVTLDHVGNQAVVVFAFHLAKAHGAHVDAGRPLQAGNFGQHKGGVATFGAGAGDHAVACAVVVQVLVGVLSAGSGDHAGATHKAVHQESHFVGVRAEGFQDEISAGAHFVVVVSGDVGAEQLGLAGFVLGTLHGVDHQREWSSSWARTPGCPVARRS
jgi:hypothetical protein